MENKTGEGLTDVAVDVIRISPALNCRWGASNNSPGGDNDAYAYVIQVKTLRVALLEDASDELSVIRQWVVECQPWQITDIVIQVNPSLTAEDAPQLSGGVASLIAMVFLIVAGDIIHFQFKEESVKEQSKEQVIFRELKQIRTSSETSRIQQLLEELTALPRLLRNTRHLLKYFQSHPDPEIWVATDALLLKEEEASTK